MNLFRTTMITAFAVSLTSLLIACGKKEEAQQAAPAPVAEAAKPDPLKVAWVYVGPVGDAGWTFAHDRGRLATEAEFGDKIVTTFVEKVPENGADAERVFRDLASQGNKLIFGTTFGYQDAMLKVAAEFPDVKFEHATGFKTASNMAQYHARTYEDAYLAGIIAGKMTKTNTLGFVASFPIPEVVRNINAYTLGAQLNNPKIKTKVVWVNTWFDPAKEREAAIALINQGADVLLQNTDSSAVLQAAEEKGKYAFGWDSDMSAFGPKAHLASAVINWDVYYKKVVGDMLNQAWTNSTTFWGVKQGMVGLTSMSEVVPQEVRDMVEKSKAAISDGSSPLFKGPLIAQDGKTVLKEGETADDAFLNSMNYYVKGVEGAFPSS